MGKWLISVNIVILGKKKKVVSWYSSIILHSTQKTRDKMNGEIYSCLGSVEIVITYYIYTSYKKK